MTKTRRLQPVLRVGQRSGKEREFTLTRERHSADPVDLQDASSVYLTMEHNRFAYTAIESGECTITDTEYGTVEYEFTPEETSLHGRYRIQFEVEYDDGTTELYPADDTTWVLDVGRRIPDKQPLSVPSVSAEEGTFVELQADELFVTNATISEVVGDPDISELSIDSLDVDELYGGIVTDSPLNGSLHGPGLTIDNGDLAVTLDIEEISGLANPFQEHADANNYDLSNVRHLTTQTLDIGTTGQIEGVRSYAVDSENYLQGFDHQFRENVNADGNSVQNANRVEGNDLEASESIALGSTNLTGSSELTDVPGFQERVERHNVSADTPLNVSFDLSAYSGRYVEFVVRFNVRSVGDINGNPLYMTIDNETQDDYVWIERDGLEFNRREAENAFELVVGGSSMPIVGEYTVPKTKTLSGSDVNTRPTIYGNGSTITNTRPVLKQGSISNTSEISHDTIELWTDEALQGGWVEVLARTK